MSIARGDSSPEGPFENAPAEPAASRPASTDRPIQNTGHGDLVIGPDGEWLLRAARRAPSQHDPRVLGARTRDVRHPVTGGTTAGRRSSPCCSPRAPAPWRSRGLRRRRARPEWLAVRRTPASSRRPPRAARLGSSCVATARRSTIRTPCSSGAARSTRRRARRSPSMSRPASAGSPCRYDERFHVEIEAGGGASPRVRVIGGLPGVERTAERRRLDLHIDSLPPSSRLAPPSSCSATTVRGSRARATSSTSRATIDGERVQLAEVDGRFLSVRDDRIVHGSGHRPRTPSTGDVVVESWFARRRRRMTDAAAPPRSPTLSAPSSATTRRSSRPRRRG